MLSEGSTVRKTSAARLTPERTPSRRMETKALALRSGGTKYSAVTSPGPMSSARASWMRGDMGGQRLRSWRKRGRILR